MVGEVGGAVWAAKWGDVGNQKSGDEPCMLCGTTPQARARRSGGLHGQQLRSDIQSASDSPCRIVIIRMPKPPSPLLTPRLIVALLIAGNFVPFSVREERDAGLSSKNWLRSSGS